MAIRDLIPWNKNQVPTTGDVYDPFVTFHREMNRLFDDVFRGVGNFGSLGRPMMEGQFGWPRIELDETDKAVIVSAELPGLSEKNVQVEIANGNGVLTVSLPKIEQASQDVKRITLNTN